MNRFICAYRLAIEKIGASIAANTMPAESRSTSYRKTGISANIFPNIGINIEATKMIIVKVAMTAVASTEKMGMASMVKVVATIK